MAQTSLHHCAHTYNTGHAHACMHAGYSRRNIHCFAGNRTLRVGTLWPKAWEGPSREKRKIPAVNPFFFYLFLDFSWLVWRDQCADPARSPTALQPHAFLSVPRPRSRRSARPARPRFLPLYRTRWAQMMGRVELRSKCWRKSLWCGTNIAKFPASPKRTNGAKTHSHAHAHTHTFTHTHTSTHIHTQHAKRGGGGNEEEAFSRRRGRRM